MLLGHLFPCATSVSCGLLARLIPAKEQYSGRHAMCGECKVTEIC